MLVIPGGEFLMGSETDPCVHAVKLDPFYVDMTCVTNEQFNEFVNATRYKTEAERFGWSFVFRTSHPCSASEARPMASAGK